MARVTAAFDIEEYLARPLVCRIATAGPMVLPVWFLWEGGLFWILTGPWSRLPEAIDANPAVALVVDTCDLGSGKTLQVVASGLAELVAFDVERGRRLLGRYLGPDVDAWDPRFRDYLGLRSGTAAGTIWARLRPDRLAARDLSFRASRPTTSDSSLRNSTGTGQTLLSRR